MNKPSEHFDSISNKSVSKNNDAWRRRSSVLRRPAVKYTLLVLGALLLITGAFYFNSHRPLSVQIAPPEHDVPVRVFGLGTVEARVRSSIGFESGAALVELNADHGSQVDKGDVLARLNQGEQEARVTKAKAAVLVAEANIRKADASLKKVRAVSLQKQEANRRSQSLVDRNLVSMEGAEETQREEDVAKADVSVALGEIDVTKALLSDARAQLQIEEILLSHRVLVAPYDAIVIERHKEIGTVVTAGEPIFTLVEVGSYWGLAYIDEARAGHLQVGDKVDARLRSRPQDAFTGVVARIGLESDRVTEERRVFIAGDNPPTQIYLGEQVEFWITVTQLEQALLVPEAAVQGYDGVQGRVWTVEEGRLKQHTVNFGHRTENARLEIVNDLPDGALVISSVDRTGFREGRLVHVVETPGK